MPQLVPDFIHPVLVHVPIVLLPLSALLAALHRPLKWAVPALPILVTLAALGAAAAWASGTAQHEPFEDRFEGTVKEDWMETHQSLGQATAAIAVVLAVAAWVPWTRPTEGRAAWWALALAVPAALVLVGAWYGGALVYETP